MMSWKRFPQAVSAVVGTLVLTAAATANTAEIDGVIRQLNESPSVAGRDAIKSYRILFDAHLEMTDPPREIGRNFNHSTIHPAMQGWDEVAGWAESNPGMADAIIAARDRDIVGLPYGRDNVSSRYQRAGLYADIGSDGQLYNLRFPYLDAVDSITAFAAAESYRRLEAGQIEEGLELALANLFVLRQFCDREFLDEKMFSIRVLNEALSNMRDMFYLYRDQISAEKFREIAVREIPFLRPTRHRLFMPEGDRVVAEALIKTVFDERAEAIPYKFAETFAAIQAKDEPLTWFGAARRWEMIAEIHSSLDASLERLRLIYDDWWRRWRVQEYDPILEIPTEFERTNPVRYAAVIHALRDIEALFGVRTYLVASVNGTAVAAAICAYHQTFGNYPREVAQTYGQFMRKSSDLDPFDLEYDHFRYRRVDSRHPIDTPYGRIWIERNLGLLYSKGQDHTDGRGTQHVDDGTDGDFVLWPPIRAVAREQGQLR